LYESPVLLFFGGKRGNRGLSFGDSGGRRSSGLRRWAGFRAAGQRDFGLSRVSWPRELLPNEAVGLIRRPDSGHV